MCSDPSSGVAIDVEVLPRKTSEVEKREGLYLVLLHSLTRLIIALEVKCWRLYILSSFELPSFDAFTVIFTPIGQAEYREHQCWQYPESLEVIGYRACVAERSEVLRFRRD